MYLLCQMLSPGPQTFTAERVRKILDGAAFIRVPGMTRVPSEFHCLQTSITWQPERTTYYTAEESQERAYRWCRGYQQSVCHHHDHFHWIDSLFSDILQFRPLVHEPDLIIMRSVVPQSTRRLITPLGETLLTNELLRETVVKAACQLLSRLPAVAMESPVTVSKGSNVFTSIPTPYFHRNAPLADVSSRNGNPSYGCGTEGGLATEVGQSPRVVLDSTSACINDMLALLRLRVAIPTGWIRPAFQQIMSYAQKLLQISIKSSANANLP